MTSKFSCDADLLALPVEEALTESENPQCWDYSRIFFTRSDKAKACDTNISAAWWLLGQLAQFELQAQDDSEPFRSMYQGEKSLLRPSDLDEITADAVRKLGYSIPDPELKARLLDVSWERLRDASAAREAVMAYRISARNLFDPENWTEYAERMERALRLARRINDQNICSSIFEEIEKKIIELDGSDPLYLTHRLMTMLIEFNKGTPATMIPIGLKAASEAEAQADFNRARSHYESVQRWERKANNKEGERAAKIAIAQSYEKQAALHAGEGGQLLVAHWLEQAHEAFRNIGGMTAETQRLYDDLRMAQERARDSLNELRGPATDLSTHIKSARESVSNKSFREALLTFAFITPPTDYDATSNDVRDLISKFPLQHIMGGVRIATDGRVIARRTPAISDNEIGAEQALWERIVEHVGIEHQFVVQAVIVPAFNQIIFEHSPSLREMLDLVTCNPFVPSGHEELFAEGFVAGFRWNFPIALSILIPQMENSLRHLLEQAGHEITKRDKQGLQNVIQLGTILNERRSQIEPIIGKNILNDLRVLFSDQHGPDLRNGMAHGTMSHKDFFGTSALYAWWLILHLCMNPVAHRFQAPPK